MKNEREILMIDDKFSKWYPILEKSSKDYGFILTNAPSVEEGLEKIKNYKGCIEAVILGLSFAAEKMQGKEGFLKIKAIDENIPVIILTAKKDDLQLISEFIRLGAYDYFSKSDINPGHLFLQVESAIQQSLKRQRVSSFTKTAIESDALKPFFYLTQQKNKFLKGYFAYRLNAIACASFENKHEAEYLCQMAFEWHINFLNTITFYDDDLTLRLRYLYTPSAEYIDTVMVIEFIAEAPEHAKFRFEEICKEFDLFMQAKKDFKKTIYYFSPISNEKELKNILFPFNTDKFFQFKPEFVEITSSRKKSIGFSNSVQNQNKNKITLPLLLKPEIPLDNFCELLSQQSSETLVEIVLNPVKLSRHEIDFLRESMKNITNTDQLTDIEKEKTCLALNAYLQSSSKCFNVEIFGTQGSKSIGKNLLSAISAGFFESATNVNVVPVKLSKDTILKKEDDPKEIHDWNCLYSLSNIANIFKFPYPFSATIPGIRSYNPIYGYFPKNISKDGMLAGFKNNGGKIIPVKINVEDLRKHVYLLGQTGTGKTTILYSMIMDRIISGKGVCVIDPHGDLHRKLLENIPEERKKDIIRFEPGNSENKIRINLLEYNKENVQEKSYLIDELFNFFRQEYDFNLTMGPMFELYMKNSLLLLMDDADDIGNIGEIAEVFQNPEFRRDLLIKCKNKEVVDFWNETALKISGENNIVNVTPYITSKLNQLLINDYIKPIVTTRKSNINFREIIDNDKILLISLSKGKIGKNGVNILGTIILSRIINAAFSRENIPEEDRKDFTLFVDEFQNFSSQSIMYAMSESRKYRLSLVLANQNLGQLNDSIKQSVLGNVGSTMFFRPGINDVDYIMPYFTPYLTRENVLTLPNYKCIGRLQINNVLSLPFIFDTFKSEDLMDYFKKMNN